MNAKSWAALEKLAEKCAVVLRDKSRQSERIWRGEMWAVISAHHDIRKAREKAKSPAVGRVTTVDDGREAVAAPESIDE